MADLRSVTRSVVYGRKDELEGLAAAAIAEGVPTDRILKALRTGMEQVGIKFKAAEFFIPEVLIASRAMKAAMKVLFPEDAPDASTLGSVVIGTVAGDLHDIGKNLVMYMLQGAGFHVVDLDVDVAPATFARKARTHQAQIVAASALLTTTRPGMQDILASLEDAGLRDSVKVMVGGAPITQEFADKIGADGYAPDAASAVDKAKDLLGISR